MFAVKETDQKDAKSHWLHGSLILNTNGPLVSSDCHHYPPPPPPLHKDEAQLERIAKGKLRVLAKQVAERVTQTPPIIESSYLMQPRWI